MRSGDKTRLYLVYAHVRDALKIMSEMRETDTMLENVRHSLSRVENVLFEYDSKKKGE